MSGLSLYWPENISRWSSLIVKYATLNGIDPDLVAAQMTQESGGNPDATGAAGELGLLQIIPRFHSCASLDPEQNIICGMSILAGHYWVTGNWRDALARYNAGVAGSAQGRGYTYADKILNLYDRSKHP